MKNKNFQNAFSLMEMMVVLLIVAIIAAATAPMVTKKMMRTAGSGDSPWVFTGLNNNIAYNMNGSDSSAIIGALSYNNDGGPTRPRLVLASGNDTNHPALAFADSNGVYSGQIDMNRTTSIVKLNDATVGNNSVAIGMNQSVANIPQDLTMIGSRTTLTNNTTGSVIIGSYARAVNQRAISIGTRSNLGLTNRDTTAGLDSIAIGTAARAAGNRSIAIGAAFQTVGATPSQAMVNSNSENSIAIGPASYAVGDNSVAIGRGAWVNANTTIQNNTKVNNAIAIGSISTASGENSIAIGAGAQATNSRSIVIGPGAQSTSANQIVLGTRDDVVYIPGRLVVDRTAVLGYGRNAAQDWGSVAVIRSNRDGRMEILQRDGDGDWDAVFANGRVDYSWATSTLSDRRLKNVGEKYTAGLEELKKLDFYHYTFKDDKDNTPLVGVMAQDLQKVFPDAVTKGEDGYLRIRLEDMFYAVINAVKELDAKVSQIVADVTGISSKVDEQQKIIEAQQQKIDELEKANADFEKRLAKLEKKNKKFEE